MKKLWSILCACAMVLGMMPVMVFNALATADVVYTIQTVKTSNIIKAGKTFTVNVTTNKISKIAGVELLFAYDATKVKAVSGIPKGFLAEFTFKHANVAPVTPKLSDATIGEVWITGMNMEDGSAASGEVIATITFEALQDIEEDLRFYCFQTPLAMAECNEITAEAVDGGVQIVAPAKITAESATAAYAGKDQNASVKVTATGDGLTYTWYVKNPGATKYSKSSITTATYKAKMTAANSGRLVYCVVKDKYGNEVRSKTFVLRMKATVTSESATAAYAKMGEKVSVKIGAAGDGLTYTWYIKNANGTKYSKSSITSATYSATISDTVKGRRIYCVVKDKYGKTAQTKTFILREAVSITTQPTTSTTAKGSIAKATVKASGDGLTYTWYIKNAGQTKYSKSSVTKATYSTTMSSTSKDRLVLCIVKDQYGNSAQSTTVKLKMK